MDAHRLDVVFAGVYHQIKMLSSSLLLEKEFGNSQSAFHMLASKLLGDDDSVTFSLEVDFRVYFRLSSVRLLV